MKVHFQRNWFAPSGVVPDPARPKGLPISGTRFRKSANKHDLRDVPEELRKFLPKTATIVENPEEAPAPVKETLRDHDFERQALDAGQAKINDAEDREFRKRFEARERKGGKR